MVELDPTRRPDLLAAAVQADLLPSKEGKHRLRFTLEDGRVLGMTVSSPAAAHLLRSMQNCLIAENSDNPAHMLVPIPLEIRRSTLAHGADASGVIVETDRLGWIALGGPLQYLEQLRTEVDRAIEAIKSRKPAAN